MQIRQMSATIVGHNAVKYAQLDFTFDKQMKELSFLKLC